jgi:hypothetical protein
VSGRRESVRKAIEESAAEVCTPSASDLVHLPQLSDGPLEDQCAMCRTRVWRHDRAWESCTSTWGLVLTANFCSCDCFAEAQECPEEVADEMRSRPGWVGR